MIHSPIPHVISLGIAAIISTRLALFAWRRRHVPGATAFVMLMLAAAWWSLTYALRITSTGLQAKLFCAKLRYLGIVIMPAAWLVFALQYSGRRERVTRRNLILLTIEPLGVLALVWTNDWHRLFWSSIRLEHIGMLTLFGSTHGVAFKIHTAYSYVLLLSGTWLFLQEAIRAPRPYRKQAIAVLVGALAPVTASAISIFGWNPFPHLDLTPFAFTLTGIAMSWGLFRLQLLDIMPVARNAVIESMRESVIVLDAQDRIVDLNPASETVLGQTASDAIGQPISHVFADHPALIEQCRDKTEVHAEITLTDNRTQQHFDLHISPLTDRPGRFDGRLIVLLDITERKQAQELVQKEKETLFSILQNAPYGVILVDEDERCLYANLEFTKITGYTLEDVPALSDILCLGCSDPDDRQQVIKDWEDSAAWQANYLCRIVCKDGATRDIKLKSTALEDGRAIVTLSDVTERQRARAERTRLLAALKHSSAQLQTIVEVSKSVSTLRGPEELMRHVVSVIQQQFQFYYTGIFLVNETGEYAQLQAGTGEAGKKMIASGHQLRVGGGSMIGQSIANVEARVALDVSKEALHFRNPHLPNTRSELALPLISPGHGCIGALTVQSVEEGAFSEEDIAILQSMADELAIAIENARFYDAAQKEIAERKRAEQALQQRNSELALLNQVGQTLTSTLELDEMLTILLEGIRHLLDVVASSVWLIDPDTDELVCRCATGAKAEMVQGWRLSPGQGIAGWAARRGKSLIVSDARNEEQYYKGVDQHTGLDLRSILTVPLRTKENMIGVLQVVDGEPDRFCEEDLILLEPLAATAASAIENARLYEQVRRDARTKAILLREINHRVKNNLSAIIGILYAARRRAGAEKESVYQAVLKDLINRLQSLAAVHSLLSESQWMPLPLSEVVAWVIRSSLRTLSPNRWISVNVTPSKIRITSDEAHDLTLVINELTTNTVKHGLQDRNTAHISARLSHDGDKIKIDFRDDGPGYPEEVLQLRHNNVGLDLVQDIVQNSLSGDVSLHNDEGAVTIITFRTRLEEASSE